MYCSYPAVHLSFASRACSSSFFFTPFISLIFLAISTTRRGWRLQVRKKFLIERNKQLNLKKGMIFLENKGTFGDLDPNLDGRVGRRKSSYHNTYVGFGRCKSFRKTELQFSFMINLQSNPNLPF